MPVAKVIARYRDGRLLKGHTHNFAPDKPMFHLMPADGADDGQPVGVVIAQLKAIFIVRDFEGDAQRREEAGFEKARPAPGKRLRVTFDDGEVMCGTSLTYNPAAMGFFIHPADADSNNLRVFVPMSAVRAVEVLPEEVRAAEQQSSKAADQMRRSA